jgi:perosamine synthetase
MLGYNYRMTEMQAALGLVQLRRLDEILKRKKQIAEGYRQNLQDSDGITSPYVAPYTTSHGYMLYTIKVDKRQSGVDRDELAASLTERGIETKVCFPPVHMQPYYRSIGYNEDLLPITEMLSEQVLSLPCYAKLTREEVDYIGRSLNEILRSYQ